MNLSGDILFDALSESFVVKKYGHYSQVLSLQRPRLYSGWGREFEENCLYIAQGEQLPGNPIFREGAVVICIGSSMPEIYRSGSYSCVKPISKFDISRIFLIVLSDELRYNDIAI